MLCIAQLTILTCLVVDGSLGVFVLEGVIVFVQAQLSGGGGYLS